MYASKLISIASAMLTTGVQAAAVHATTAPIPGYGVADFTWEVETAPGGLKMNFTGTVQEVVAQLSTVNPNWETDFNFSAQKRSLSFPFTSVLCNLRLDEWGIADRGRIRDGINYLNGVPGNPTNGPGPGNCGRVSCSFNSAIWWCNDEPNYLSLPGFSTIAAGAGAILDNCPSVLGTTQLNGQVFAQFLQNWNVIIRANIC